MNPDAAAKAEEARSRERSPGEPTCASEATLWSRYREAGDEAAREALVKIHLPYARVMAATLFSRRMHDEIEFGDYLQLATLGLLESVGRFDPRLGVSFRTFAARRMHGSILDGLEKLTEKQRQIAARQRLEAERRNSIKESERGQDKVPSEPDKLLQYVAEAGIGFALAWLLDGTGMVKSEERSESLPFYRNREIQELRQRILELVQSLPTQERKVIHGHYLQQEPFERLCASMQLSKGRISQLHRSGLARLREGLRGQGGLDRSY